MLMSGTERLSVDLPEVIVAQLRKAVETGDHPTTSDAVQDALIEWQTRRTLHDFTREELRRQIAPLNPRDEEDALEFINALMATDCNEAG